MVPHPVDPEPQQSEYTLTPVNLREPSGSDLSAIGEPTRKARERRFVPHGKVDSSCCFANLCLRKPEFIQGRANPVFTSSFTSRTVISTVIEIEAIKNIGNS
jgi:hypothetical protein